MGNNFYNLIRRPVITEKSTQLGESNKYTFEVSMNADKKTIKKAIEDIFPVKVKDINTIISKGKNKRFKGIKGSQSNHKKAVITLEENYSIDLTGSGK